MFFDQTSMTARAAKSTAISEDKLDGLLKRAGSRASLGLEGEQPLAVFVGFGEDMVTAVVVADDWIQVVMTD